MTTALSIECSEVIDLKKKAMITPTKGAVILAAFALLAFIAVILWGYILRTKQHPMSNEDRLYYLADIGYTAEEIPTTEQIITLPTEFPPVLEQYNTLQLQQGFDLKQYKGKQVEMYVYKLLNYPAAPDSGDVYACLYIFKGTVIAGDIHSASMTGFMTALKQ